jgi:hypothetical protein
VDGTVFSKQVSGRIHFLRKPLGIAFDVTVIEDAKRLGADRLRVTDTDTGQHYHATMKAVEQKGISIDRGHGRQVVLPMRYWSASFEQALVVEMEDDVEAAKQLSMEGL